MLNDALRRIADALHPPFGGFKMSWLDLAEAMSDISEEGYCAGWLHDLEFALWHMVLRGTDCLFGQTEVKESQLLNLKRLSNELGGWVVWDDVLGEERFVPMDEWLPLYESFNQRPLELLRVKSRG